MQPRPGESTDGAPAAGGNATFAQPGRIRRAAAWFAAVSLDNAEGAVYGALMIGVLLAAEDAGRETYAETIAATAVVLLIYWFVHLYTYVLGVRLRTSEQLDRALLRKSALHELPVMEGGIAPLLVLAVGWVGGASVPHGVTAAVITTVICIIVLEIVAAWRARARGLKVWLLAALGALSGLGVVAVKVLLHV